MVKVPPPSPKKKVSSNIILPQNYNRSYSSAIRCSSSVCVHLNDVHADRIRFIYECHDVKKENSQEKLKITFCNMKQSKSKSRNFPPLCNEEGSN